MARTAKPDESAENTEFGKRMIEGLNEALAWRRGELALPVHTADANWIDEDDAPDLSTPEYQAKFATKQPRRA